MQALNRTKKAVLVAGFAISVAFLAVDIYLAGIAFIIMAVVLMSFFIQGDSYGYPDVVASLSEDTREIIFRNRGNAPANKIRITLIPIDEEIIVDTLPMDGIFKHSFAHMVNEVKTVISFENEAGKEFRRTFLLSSLSPEDEDLLRPAFPIFSWKEEK
jgi:hypothetical protein